MRLLNKLFNSINKPSAPSTKAEEESNPSPTEPETEPQMPDETEATDSTIPDLPPISQSDFGQTAPLEPWPATAPTWVPPISVGPQPTTDHYEPIMRVAKRCHIGASRNRNEDACLTFVSQAGGNEPMQLLGIYIVADGMGGHFDGHRASKIVSRTLAQHILERLYLPMLRGDNVAVRQPIQEIMAEGVVLANKAIYTSDPEKTMGTTLTAALILGRRLYLVHVGDSRAYLLKEGHLEQITKDHSIVKALQDAGQITPEEAASHPNRNLLYRALMGRELEQVDTFTQALPKSGMLMLCSDGLWGLVSGNEIEAILTQEIPLQQKADILVKKALEMGGHDNITVVLVDYVL